MMNDQIHVSNKFKNKSGIKRVLCAFVYSITGLRVAVKTEKAFLQELLLFVPATVLALCLPISGLEKYLLIASMMLVLVVELINSAIEAVVDRISLEINPLSKNAKDFGSAAVLLALLMSAGMWCVIVLPLFI